MGRPPSKVTTMTPTRFLKLATPMEGELRAKTITTLQINVGKKCNQACLHCHVEAGPNRTEMMDERVAAKIISLIETEPNLQVLDITGGAPELSNHFRSFVEAGSKRGIEVIDRCNLTILFESGQEDLAEFLAEHNVRVVASLPCYSEKNVDKQRGLGVFDKSIGGLIKLNQLGYGKDKVLDLVYNPTGPSLPPSQEMLQQDYKAKLKSDFGIVFNSLLTITNVAINRFEHALKRDGQLEDYVSLLESNFNHSTVNGLMCRSMVSIAYDGTVYDCDFNQMLPLDLLAGKRNVLDVDSLSEFANRSIAVADHCLACTAGAGSSCGGAIA